MKIAVECRSILLQKAVEKFLGKYLSGAKQSDLIVRDFRSEDAKTFYIGEEKDADLVKPFSKSQLLLALENKYNELDRTHNTPSGEIRTAENKNFEILEKRIEILTQEYKKGILEAIKAFYG